MTIIHLERLVRSIVLAALSLVILALPSRGQGASLYLEVIALDDLDYGIVSDVSGPISVGKTYPYVGKFKIRGRFAQPPGSFPEVDLTFIPPSVLNGTQSTIPYTMEASTNSEADVPAASTTISGTTARITLEDYEGHEQGLPVYAAYAYVFGTIDVTGVAPGDYIAPLELEAEAVLRGPPVCRSDPWSRRTRYYRGDIVVHDGAAWEANRFTIGNEPGRAHDWDDAYDDDDDDDDDGDDDRPGNRFGNDDDDRGNNGRGRGNGNGRGNRGGDDDDDDDDNGNGEPGGGRPWDFVTFCQ